MSEDLICDRVLKVSLQTFWIHIWFGNNILYIQMFRILLMFWMTWWKVSAEIYSLVLISLPLECVRLIHQKDGIFQSALQEMREHVLEAMTDIFKMWVLLFVLVYFEKIAPGQQLAKEFSQIAIYWHSNAPFYRSDLIWYIWCILTRKERHQWIERDMRNIFWGWFCYTSI